MITKVSELVNWVRAIVSVQIKGAGGAEALPCRGFGGLEPNLPSPLSAPLPRVGGVGGGSSPADLPKVHDPKSEHLPDGAVKTQPTDPPGFLANTGVFTLTRGISNQVEMGLMRTGDANNDNIVTVLDVGILKNTYGKGVGDPGYDNRANFNGDNTVNIIDYNLLKNNFGLAGAPPLGLSRTKR